MDPNLKGTGLLSEIESEMESMSKGRRSIAAYILENYDKAIFMTAAALGKKVGVSESTVVRFAMHLGFDGYPKLQRALQGIVKNKLTTLQRIDITNNYLKGGDVVQSVMNLDISRIRATIDNIDRNEFDRAVELLSSAETVYVLGTRSTYSLSQFITFYFNYIFDRVKCVTGNSADSVFDQLFKISKKDVFIAIGFPRYSMTTIKAARFAKEKNASVIAITDMNDSPLGEISDISLVAASSAISFMDSLVAPLSLINALIVALAMKRKDEIPGTLEELEKIWKEYEVYQSQDE